LFRLEFVCRFRLLQPAPNHLLDDDTLRITASIDEIVVQLFLLAQVPVGMQTPNTRVTADHQG
jgi:hypothetical protein